MLFHLNLHGSSEQSLDELLEDAVLAENVLRLFVVCGQMVN
jgi:hypothetical protein